MFYVCVCVFKILQVAFLRFNEASASGRGRRRFSSGSAKLSADEVTDKTSADPMTASSTNTEPNSYRRGGAYSADQGGEFLQQDLLVQLNSSHST